MALSLGACDDSGPVPGGESGAVVDDDGGETGQDTTGTATSPTTAGATTTTDPSTTSDTTTPTPTTMDPTEADSSSGDPTDPTTSGCTPGTQGCDCDEGTCVGNLMCVGGACVQDVDCGVDIYEDNNTEADASDLGTISDDDDDAVTITGVLEGDDVDWFTYFGEDNLLSTVNPSRNLTTAGALRMCKFVECDSGLFTTEVTCPEGTAAAESPEGRPGCCGDDTFEIDLGCAGVISDDARVWIRFDQGLADCTQYTLEYHY